MLVRVNLELEGFAVVEAATLEEAEAAVARGRARTSFSSTSTSRDGRRSACSRACVPDGVPVALVTGSVDVEEYRDAADAVLVEAVRAASPRRRRAAPR